jgi:sec-independent protein translocase protein TatA
MFEGLFQPSHLVLVLVVVVFMFGPSKLPQIGAGMGKSIRDFKKAMAESDAIRPAAAAKSLPAPATAESAITAGTAITAESAITAGSAITAESTAAETA